MRVLVFGSINVDTTLIVDKIPQIGETVLANNLLNDFGGKGSNQAVSIARLGHPVSFLGAVGDDANGKASIEKLVKEGVDTKFIRVFPGAHTGIAMINVDHVGNNNIVVYSGANYELSSQFFDEYCSILKNFDMCVLQQEIPIEVLNYVIKYSIENGIKLVINPAPYNSDMFMESYKGVDYLIPNEFELASMVGGSVDENMFEKYAKQLVNAGVKNVIVTLGDKGSLWVDKNHSQYFEAVKVNAVDTTAAGDSFIGGFVVGLTRNYSIEKSIAFATKVASLTVQNRGAQDSLPYKVDIDWEE